MFDHALRSIGLLCDAFHVRLRETSSYTIVVVLSWRFFIRLYLTLSFTTSLPDASVYLGSAFSCNKRQHPLLPHLWDESCQQHVSDLSASVPTALRQVAQQVSIHAYLLLSVSVSLSVGLSLSVYACLSLSRVIDRFPGSSLTFLCSPKTVIFSRAIIRSAPE